MALQSHDLQKVLGLDDNQTVIIERIIYAKKKRLIELEATKSNLTAEEVAKKMTSINNNYKAKMMDVLSEEQFQAMSEYMAQQKGKKKLKNTNE